MGRLAPGGCMPTDTSSVRSVSRIVDSVEALEGAGFLVHRPFPTRALSDFDPFLLLDEMGPMDLGPGEARGAPDHPHRGFETVTYMLEGVFEHRDSAGHAGRLGPGDVQWMTAGRGVVHSEVPAKEFKSSGGRLHGSQLWVNLPRRDKMIPPRYQEIPSARIPVAGTPDGRVTVRVIAGEALGARAVIETRIPILYLHFTLLGGGQIRQPVPGAYNVFAYVLAGEGLFGADRRKAGRGQMVLFAPEGNAVSMAAPENVTEPLSTLLIAGLPLHEPIARLGPFVMNTQAEIDQAIADYQSGRMGAITY
jgi:redox-sensitive bicupin YhaK (pirin superfamily)